MADRYTDLNTYFKKRYGCRVHKISLDAGFSCPNRDGTVGWGGCIYCNARGSGTGAHARGLSITEQLQEAKTRLARRYKAKKFIAYFQAYTNTYAPVATLEKYYDEALAVPDVVGLSIGTRPDTVAGPVLDLLQGYAVDRLVWIEYGLQSAHDRTLALINRGHDAAAFVRAVENTRNRRIRICAHIILGLPGEDRSHVLKTAEFISGLGLDGIKLHLLYVIRGTPLADMHHRGTYRCLEQQAYVDLVCDFLERIPRRLIVQRLTGDPHPDELVAPRWALKKNQTLQLIRDTLAQRNVYQGQRCGDPGL